MTKDEALTLEALKYAASLGHGSILREMKITPFTIKREEALAQPEQGPVLLNGLTEAETNSSASVMGLINHMQPKQEPLTKTKVGNYLRHQPLGDVGTYRNGFKDGVRFAEAAHGIKENT